MKQLVTYLIYSMSLDKEMRFRSSITRWDEALLSASEVPEEIVLESSIQDENT